MYLLFPDVQVLQFAISSGLIPSELAAAPCQAALLSDDTCLLKAAKRSLRRSLSRLEELGVGMSRFSPVRVNLQSFTSWLQLIPIARRVEHWELSSDVSQALFVFPDWPELAAASQEILRLGNDRQAMSSFEFGETQLHLLRVTDPPLYSMLAFAEKQNVLVLQPCGVNVWVQSGFQHPLQERIAAPADVMLLISEPFGWLTAPNEPFVDLYERADFQLSEPAATLPPSTKLGRIRATLRLRDDSSPADATLWVVRGDAIERLHQVVETSSDDIVTQLAFAVATDENGADIVVLRARGEQTRPLTLPGEGYRSYLRIPNLFVPLGRRIHPPLRRDAAAKTLAPDPSQIVWLAETDSGFRPQQLADDAFRPLHDWVDYVIELEAESLAAWVDSQQFAFDSFACDEDISPATQSTRGDDPDGPDDGAATSTNKLTKGSDDEAEEDSPTVAPLQKVKKEENPSELRHELRAVERSFAELDEPLDSDTRREMWMRMGELHTHLKDDVQAALCFSNAAWSRNQAGSLDANAAWSAALGGDKLDKLLGGGESSSQSARLLGVLASADDARRAEIAEQIQSISPAVENLEPRSSVRMIWLAWLSLSKASGGDVLALSRARDRLLNRLFEEGLRADVDLPLFLRNSEVDQERYAQVRDYLQTLPEAAGKWIKDQSALKDGPSTTLFANLYIAFGLARIGERDLSDLLKSESSRKDPVSKWVRDVIAYRIRQVARGEPADGPLTKKLMTELEGAKFNSPASRARQNHKYLVDRLRSESRILEPKEKIDPYRHITQLTAVAWKQTCLEMQETRDPDGLRAAMKRLLTETRDMRDTQPYCQSLAACLEFAPRLDEETADQLLRLCQKAVAKSRTKSDVARIIKHGVYLAGHFELDGRVKQLLALFHEQLLTPDDVASRKALDETLFECFDGLRRLGLRSEISSLLDRLMEVADELAKPRRGRSVESTRELRLKLLLHAASGRFYFGQIHDAESVLDVVRKAMLSGGLSGQSRGRAILATMAHRYVCALRHAPIQVVIQRIDDLLTNLRGVYDNFTTTVLYSRTQLTFLEECVLVLVSDDVALSTGGRKWLDDDEYLVRKRIHADVRAALGTR